MTLIAASSTVGLAIVALIVVGGSWLLRKVFFRKREQGQDPLSARFAANVAANQARREREIAELPEGDPLREWARAGGTLGWIGRCPIMFFSFLEKNEDLREPVRGVRFECGDREPKLTGLPKLPYPFGVDLWNSAASDRLLSALVEQSALSVLRLGLNKRVTDSSMKIVSRMSNLRGLDISSTEVTSKGADQLIVLSQLRALSIGVLPSKLFRELRSLEALELKSFELDDSRSELLDSLSRLLELNLGFHSLTNEGLAPLAKMRELRRLSLAGYSANEECLSYLGALTRLETLRAFGRNELPREVEGSQSPSASEG